MTRRHDDKDDAGVRTVDTYYNITNEAGGQTHIHIHVPPSANVNVTFSSEATFGIDAITVGSVGAPVPGDGGRTLSQAGRAITLRTGLLAAIRF